MAGWLLALLLAAAPGTPLPAPVSPLPAPVSPLPAPVSPLPAPVSSLPSPRPEQSPTPPELIERTLAIVGGRVITLSDARVAVTLGLVDVEAGADPVRAATARLVDRELILREVRRYAPPSPADADIEARLAGVRARFAPPGDFARTLAGAGLSEARLRAWVTDDLRAEAYLAQRFAAASVPTDGEIAAAYQQQRDAFDRAGVDFAAAAPRLREQVAATRRQALIADWVSDLRRRTDVVLLIDR